jgi:hypothetical protein
MIVTAEQRREHMEAAVSFIRNNVSSADVLFTDKPTSFQLMHYLCGPKSASVETSNSGFDSYHCDGLRVISTDLGEGSLTPQSFPAKLHAMESNYSVNPAVTVWIVQAAWSSGLGKALSHEPENLYGVDFSEIKPHVFDRYIEVFKLPPPKAVSVAP